ncbi:MAG: CHAT domain-containing protein [Pelagibacteraceae bacterium]|nr:CHAT domain-containing protein [Pelagibacteraceae bacterium]
MKFHLSTYQNNYSKFIPILVFLFFILLFFFNSNSIISKENTCNKLTNSALDTKIFKADSKVYLMSDKNLAIKANKICIKQLSKNKDNPQFNFQVAYTFLALKDYETAKKYLDIAIKKKYPAALLYSAIANKYEWINYENEYKENLIQAAKFSYFAKYQLAFDYLLDAWYQDDLELSKKNRKKAIKLFNEIDFFIPAKNFILIEKIKDNILNYNEVKKLSEEIEKNSFKIIKKYETHGFNYAIEILYELGLELGNNGYSNLAIPYIERVIEYSEKRYKKLNFTKDEITYDQAFTYQLLAYSLFNTGKLNKSEEYWIKTINLIQNNKELFSSDPVFYANSLNNFGLNYAEMKEYELAVKLFRQSSKEYKNFNDNTLWSLLPLVNISLFTENKEEALELSKFIFEDIKKRNIDLKSYVRTIQVLINHHIDQGEVNDAKRVFEEMVSFEKDERHTDPVNRFDKFLIEIIYSRILILEKKYEEAKKNLIDTNDLIEGEKFLDFSDYTSLKSFILETFISLENEFNDKKLSNIINFETDLFSSKILNYIENSDDFTDEKIKEITGISSGLFLDLRRKIKNNVKINDKDFKIIQLLSMTEVDFSSLSLEQRLKNNNSEKIKKLQILNHELKILKKKFTTSRSDDIKDTIKEIEESKNKIFNDIGITDKININFYTLENFKKNLKSNEAFVIFLETNENNRLSKNILLRIYFNGKSFNWFDLSNEYQNIKSNIKKTIDSVKIESWPPQDFATVASHNLFKALFKNINFEKIRNKNLLIKNNGLISTIPFNILVKDFYNDPRNYETISWVIDNNKITNIGTFKYFFTNKKNKLISKTFLGIGNPNFKKKDKPIKLTRNNSVSELSKIMTNRSNGENNLILDQLPETENEIRNISKLFLKKNRYMLISKDASETKIKKINLKKYNYIVFATHAIPKSETTNSKFSGLALSYPNKVSEFDNGFLNAQEIMKIDLNSDLVLLSACETATDDQASGRAFSGMVNSFFFAGSNSVVASHWKIESNSTVLITTSFFENLINKNDNTTEALRNSILNFRENNKDEFSHPAFWGAFSVILNSREI